MRRAGWRIGLALVLLAAPAGAVAAFEPLSGCFVADAVCPARPSIRGQSNPGAIATEPGRAYPLRGANQKGRPSHLQLLILEAEPRDRWVAAGCGHVVAACAEAPAPPPVADYVLAASWQPAFCEEHRRPPECRSQTADRFDASHFALHGLWPEPPGNDYCRVSRALRAADEAGRWRELPPVELTARTRAELALVMPGTASGLDRHQWLKHGTCYGVTPEEYFAEALALTQQLNASRVLALFAAKVGEWLGEAELRAAFERSFGAGAGARVTIDCSAGMITELKISLRGAIDPGARLADLIAAARPAPEGCRGGRIDAVGSAW